MNQVHIKVKRNEESFLSVRRELAEIDSDVWNHVSTCFIKNNQEKVNMTK